MAHLSARQRGQVHMHSSIFSSDAPSSVYDQKRQHEVYENIKGSLRENNRRAPNISLPSAEDMQCTQNWDHGAVIPGSERRQHARQAWQADGEMCTPRMARTSGPEALYHDGEAIPVSHANRRDRECMPKEFWHTTSNLEWHDTRHEACRDRQSGRRQNLTAEEMKRQDMSSEIFGKPRMTDSSASKLDARRDLMADSADGLAYDSNLHRKNGYSYDDPSKYEASAQDARERFHQNMGCSARNTMTQGSPQRPQQAPPVEDQDPANYGRRRGEKNFSDLFGAQMGERRDMRGQREEVLASDNCRVFDFSSEIAARNKAHWKVEGETAADRKHLETTSHLFDYQRPQRPEVDADAQRVTRGEGACWEATDSMQTHSEIARRRRMKDHMRDFEGEAGSSHHTRKQDLMASDQVRMNWGSSQHMRPMARSPREYQPQPQSPRSFAGTASGREVSAREAKIASMQSNIFF